VWLDAYLRDVYEPTAADFRALRKQVEHWRRVYVKNYREVSGGEEVEALFAKTTIIELKALFAFLRALHGALGELYHNGRRPVVSGGLGATVHERIALEAERFLLAAAGGGR
jgi:hypothetical protein